MLTKKVLALIALYTTINISVQALDLNRPAFHNTIPTPDAAALGMYADVPVSLYTGTPEINILLYEIELTNFKLPISLSYHASGIKAAQEASSVGLGWALNSGGVITRTIRDKDDFDPILGYRIYKGGYPQQSDIVYKSREVYIFDYSDCGALSFNANNCSEQLSDMEPDIFSYNFNGITGRFTFNKGEEDLVINLNPENMIKIQPYFDEDNTRKHMFFIRTIDGVRYYFEPVEQCKSYVRLWESTSGGPYFSINSRYGNLISSKNRMDITWYLKKIYLPNQEVITFDYTTKSNNVECAYETYIHETYDEGQILSTKQWIQEDPSLICHQVNHCIASRTLTGAQYFNVAVPQKISWSNGYIEFISSERVDLKDVRHGDIIASGAFSSPFKLCRKIDRMDIYSSASSVPVKTIKFITSYFGSKENAVVTTNSAKLRLKLDEIEFYGDANNKYKYKLTYNESLPLMPKTTRAIDHWGYMNATNEPSDVTTLPKIYTEKEIYSTQPIVFQGGNYLLTCYKPKNTLLNEKTAIDRDCNPNLVTLGILSSITYPTGGTTYFEYEPHEYLDRVKYSKVKGGGVRIKKAYNDAVTKEYDYNENSECQGVLLSPYRYYDIGSFQSDIPGHFFGVFYLAMLQSDPVSALETAVNGYTVGYTQVRESFVDGNDRYSEVSVFSNEQEQRNNIIGLPNIGNIMNGKILSKYYRDKNNIVQKTDRYNYQAIELDSVPAYKYTAMRKNGGYVVKSQYVRLLSDNTVYSNAGNKLNTYTYKDDKFPLPSKITTTSGMLGQGQQVLVHNIRYPKDLTATEYANMKYYNVINVPIEESFVYNGNLMLKRLTTYSGNGPFFYLPRAIYETRSGKAELTYDGNMMFPAEYSEHEVAQFKDYDSNGNCIQFVGKDKIPVIMLYCKNSLSPMAIIRGANFSEVTNIINPYESVKSTKNISQYPSLYERLPKAEIQTADYQPLVGPVKTSMPTGCYWGYTYDKLGRLIKVVDSNNKVTNAFEYNLLNK